MNDYNDPGPIEPAEMCIIIVDDDDLVRGSLSRLFRPIDFQVQSHASAHSLLHELESLKQLSNACLMLDLRMPMISGLELQQKLRHAGVQLPIIFYTGTADVNTAVQAMTAGAYTVLEKPLSNQVLIDTAIAAILDHNQRLELQQRTQQARRQLTVLTPRERQVAELVAQGHTATDIGLELHLSPRTVENHKYKIMAKLGIHHSHKLVELVTLASIYEEPEA